MYQQRSGGWLKHGDFILLDLLMAEVSFVIAYFLRHRDMFFEQNYYVSVALYLAVIDLVVSAFYSNYNSILRRSPARELWVSIKHDMAVSMLLVVLLYLMRRAEPFSRLTFAGFAVIYAFLCFGARQLLKSIILGRLSQNPNRSIILLTTSTRARDAVKRFRDNAQFGFRIAGLILYDRDGRGEQFDYVPVVTDLDGAPEDICRNWVDELFADLPEGIVIPGRLFKACMDMGVTVHQRVAHETYEGGEQVIEKLAGCTVMTTALRMISPQQALVKRLMDICGGLVGSFFTLVLTVFIGPLIFLRSPGPIFFKQERIGQNGKKFKIYKFRSMYLDAEERKKELMEHNKIKDGMMFKMDDDPRIIKGVGHFIRNHSLDEFPQFFNVVAGSMSLVGTRPPTVDEWEKYDVHHRVRMSVKPGITGMWQVSGRSKITDFEEVVALDEEYIRKWNVWLDVKILLKTLKVMVTKDGAS